MPGASRLGDKAKAKIDHHGCHACPHHDVQGPGIFCSSNVFINGIGALTTASVGIHSACCGPNTWVMQAASGRVFVNGAALVRQGDPTIHCGVSPGEIIDASVNVSDGSPMQKVLAEVAKTFATGGLEAMSELIKDKSSGISGALAAAKGLKWGGVVAGGALEVLPAAVHGDAKGVARGIVSTGAGVAAGGFATGVCEGGTLGLGTPACVAGGIAIGGGVSWGAGKVFDGVTSLFD
ncbi:MAG TPA: hypothetical protein VFD36_21345 [Kofleriaceae bacterium]|nr:hypothetical protein [Kofleriaceae bacterium]